MHLIIAPKETEVKLKWDYAKKYCEHLRINGYSNWRLPTTVELRFLMNKFPASFEPSSYWTSTERWNGSPGADFIDCRICNSYQSCWKEETLLVRAVRTCNCICTNTQDINQ